MRRDIISQIHSHIRAALRTHEGVAGVISAADSGTGKEYPRMPQIVLPKPRFPTISLADALQKRTSDVPIGESDGTRFTTNELSTLFAAAGMKDAARRTYPSGGRLFPIELYFIGPTNDTKETRVYHYHQRRHSLEDLWKLPDQFTLFDVFGSYLDQKYASRLRGALVYTSVWQRSAAKYGDFAYSLGLLEAGHIAQNILLAATALGIGARPMGGFLDTVLNEMLDIDNNDEQVVYATALY